MRDGTHRTQVTLQKKQQQPSLLKGCRREQVAGTLGMP
jgi:hypothetical protein